MLSLAANVFAVNVEIDGLKYDLVSTTKEATVLSNNYSGDIVIPDNVVYEGTTYSVTSIGTAFRSCYSLTSVTIPNSVTSIGYNAFSECYKLVSVSIGNSVTSIGDYAFWYCSKLTSITIPNSVTSIGASAFSNCSKLTSITIPNSVTSIGSSAFSSCSGLTSVSIGNSVTSIGASAFMNCSGLTSVTIPNSVTSIGSYAFSYCSGLTSVTIGNSVTSIGASAFSSCSGLTSVTIPNSVTSIGASAFSQCSGLTSVTIGNSVTSIGSNAFSSCSGLTAVTIGNSVTSIGSNAFSSCSGLTSVTIPNSVKNIGDYAFYSCSGLTSVTIPNSVTSIGDATFSGCSGLTSVTIPNSVTSIGASAFSGCSGLTSVTIPNSVTSIGNYAFQNCNKLTDVYCYAENVPTTNAYAFYNSHVENVSLHVLAASVDAYKAAEPWSGFKEIVALTVPVTISSSGWSTFSHGTALDFSGVTGLTAYVVTKTTNSSVTLSPVTEVPANTGVILQGTAGQQYDIPYIASAEAPATNLLQAAVTATPVNANEVYVLKDGAFHLVTAASTVPAGKAYLLAGDVPSAGARPLTFEIGEELTGIEKVQEEGFTGNGAGFYNLQGQRIAQPAKGLYIINGKKVIIK